MLCHSLRLSWRSLSVAATLSLVAAACSSDPPGGGPEAVDSGAIDSGADALGADAGGDGNAADTSLEAAPADAATDAACAAAVVDSTIAGLSATLTGACAVKAGVGGKFEYTVTLDHAVTFTLPGSGGACGACFGNAPNVGSLLDVRVGGGADSSVRYCSCDKGCCVPTTAHAVRLEAGTTQGTLDWPGKEWDGPSDTGNQPGAPFPPGSYFVTLNLNLAEAGQAVIKFPISVR